MLVLTRRVNESIMIGDDIKITVVAVQGHGPHAQIRLGISAPRETAVLRQEVYEAVRLENQRALRTAHAPDENATAGDGPGDTAEEPEQNNL